MNKIINSFRDRGWALYISKDAFVHEDEIQECVEKGSEKENLEPGTPYSVFPYVEKDDNWKEVKKERPS